jgi:3-ketosteroid 9alpha-monooxygenase subunit A
VHGYQSIAVDEDLHTDGPHLGMGYVVTRAHGLLGRRDPTKLRMRLHIRASGIGYSRVQVNGLPIRLRTVVMPTPVDDETTEVRVITQVALVGPRWLPRRFVADRIAHIAAREMARDFLADLRIWEHKRYQDPPRLVPGDGPIGPYRRWTKQFYRDARASAASATVGREQA